MEDVVKYRLHFEEKDGILSAQLSYDAWAAIIEASGCLPWSANGKRGLLYCNMKTYEKAEQELQAAVKESPLIAQIICKVAHWLEIDESGLLCIPRQAAQFARISGDAVLCQISEGYLLLLAEDQEAKQPKGGTLIQVEF